MNILEVTLSDGTVRLGDELVATGRDRSGPVSIGIRPEALRLSSESGMSANVRWIENLGSQYLIGVQAGEISLVVLSSEPPGSKSVRIQFDPKDLHVFDKDAGESLAGSSARHTVRC